MKNIEAFDQIDSRVERTDFGTITTLTTAIGFSAKDSINFGEKTISANYVDSETSYNVVYSVVDSDGNVEGSYVEEDGISPTLFKSPDREIYVSMIPYHPDKEPEISIPLFNREHVEMPKPNRPFTGDFIGTVNQSAIFHDVDIWSDKKPDKLLNIEYKNGRIKKKHTIKLDFPKNNHLCIHDNEIHLLGREDDVFVHRRIDEMGNVIQERRVNRGVFFCRQAITLGFDKPSSLLAGEDGKFLLLKIDADGRLQEKELFDIQDEIFNAWPPTEIAKDTYVIRFTTEFGNGWFSICEDNLLELYYGKDVQGYKNLLTGDVIELGRDDLILSSLNKTKDNSYAVIFYPRVERGENYKELLLLNKTLG